MRDYIIFIYLHEYNFVLVYRVYMGLVKYEKFNIELYQGYVIFRKNIPIIY